MVGCFHNNLPFPTDANNHSYLCMHMVNCICSFLQWYNLWYVSLYLAYLTIMVEVVSLYVSSHILHMYILQIIFCFKTFYERSDLLIFKRLVPYPRSMQDPCKIHLQRIMYIYEAYQLQLFRLGTRMYI